MKVFLMGKNSSATSRTQTSNSEHHRVPVHPKSTIQKPRYKKDNLKIDIPPNTHTLPVATTDTSTVAKTDTSTVAKTDTSTVAKTDTSTVAKTTVDVSVLATSTDESDFDVMMDEIVRMGLQTAQVRESQIFSGVQLSCV